jgi:predicted small integral membrane protein
MSDHEEPTAEIALTVGEMVAGFGLLLLSFGGGFLLAVLMVALLPFAFLGLAAQQLWAALSARKRRPAGMQTSALANT